MTGLGEGLPHSTEAVWRRILPVWGGLMALLLATLGGAYIPLGSWNLVLALLIATTKAALVVIFFMQLRRPDPLLRLAALAALIFVAFLFVLTFADVLRRAAPTQPGSVTPRTDTPDRTTGKPAF